MTTEAQRLAHAIENLMMTMLASGETRAAARADLHAALEPLFSKSPEARGEDEIRRSNREHLQHEAAFAILRQAMSSLFGDRPAEPAPASDVTREDALFLYQRDICNALRIHPGTSRARVVRAIEDLRDRANGRAEEQSAARLEAAQAYHKQVCAALGVGDLPHRGAVCTAIGNLRNGLAAETARANGHSSDLAAAQAASESAYRTLHEQVEDLGKLLDIPEDKRCWGTIRKTIEQNQSDAATRITDLEVMVQNERNLTTQAIVKFNQNDETTAALFRDLNVSNACDARTKVRELQHTEGLARAFVPSGSPDLDTILSTLGVSADRAPEEIRRLQRATARASHLPDGWVPSSDQRGCVRRRDESNVVIVNETHVIIFQDDGQGRTIDARAPREAVVVAIADYDAAKEGR